MQKKISKNILKSGDNSGSKYFKHNDKNQSGKRRKQGRYQPKPNNKPGCSNPKRMPFSGYQPGSGPSSPPAPPSGGSIVDGKNKK